MDRRSFIQTAGNVAALSVLHGTGSPLGSGTPGKILAIAAHPGDVCSPWARRWHSRLSVADRVSC
jgi:hypothetical protein